MTTTRVYKAVQASNRTCREAVAYENVENALITMANVDRRLLDGRRYADSAMARTAPGLLQVKTSEQIIALGRAAHTMLADHAKRTVIASDIDFQADSESREQTVADINRFFWSCINTSKIVALGDKAWRSVQLLPLKERRVFGMPPLRLSPLCSPTKPFSLLIVDHDEESATARDLAAFLKSHQDDVEYVGVRRKSKGDDPSWTSAAHVHIHVGHHTIATDNLRLVDSWHSRRLAIQLLPRRSLQSRSSGDDVLLIEDGVNGFIQHTPEAVRASCEELRSDRVLQKKFIEAGHWTVAPLAQKWRAIAEELLE